MSVMERELLMKFGKLGDTGKRNTIIYVTRLADLEVESEDSDQEIFDDLYEMQLETMDFWDNEEDEVWDSV